MKRFLTVFAAAVVFFVAADARSAPHTLYLNFTGDANFPEFGSSNYNTSPLSAFDASQLDSNFGSAEANQIMTSVFNFVTADYYEFDLNVTMTKPSSGPYQTVGIDHTIATWGSGSNQRWNFGKANGIDNDPDDVDHGRVFGGSFGDWSSAWQGTNSTVDRWSYAIAETTAHEAGHNYGVKHPYSAPNSAESAAGDSQSDHLLATGSTGLTPEERTVDRHFSDTSYGVLAANLGLNSRTLTNWAFRNPNDVKAHDFHINFRSQHSSLTVTSELGRDPFGTYAVTNMGQTTIDGKTWYEYEVEWADGNGVEAGALWYSGIKLSGLSSLSPIEAPYVIQPLQPVSDDLIITDTYLTDANGDRMPLRPRTVSYGSGDLDSAGTLSVPISNDSDEPLVLRNMRFRLVPRMIDPDTMVAESTETPMSADGHTVSIFEDILFPGDITLLPGEETSFALADFNNWLAVKLAEAAGGGGGANDSDLIEVEYLEPSTWRDMFPSAYIYGTGSVVMLNQQVWDPELEQFIFTDVETEVFFQLSGLPVTLPEPLSVTMFILGAVALLGRRRKV